VVVDRINKYGRDIVGCYFADCIDDLSGNGRAVNVYGFVGNKKIIKVGNVVLAAPCGDALPESIITFTRHVHNNTGFGFVAVPGFARCDTTGHVKG
jgi:hypothetical protein